MFVYLFSSGTHPISCAICVSVAICINFHRKKKKKKKVTLTVRTTAVERFVCSHLSPTLLPGELGTKRSTAVVQTVTASVTVWLRETSCRKCTQGSQP